MVVFEKNEPFLTVSEGEPSGPFSHFERVERHLEMWHSCDDLFVYTRKKVGFDPDVQGDEEDRAYFVDQMKRYEQEHRQNIEAVADALERTSRPREYLAALERIIDSEALRPSEHPVEKLASIAPLIREPETATELAEAAERWNVRFPIVFSTDPEMPTYTHREGQSFLDVFHFFTKDKQGVPTRPADLLYDLNESFEEIEELYGLEKAYHQRLPCIVPSEVMVQLQKHRLIKAYTNLYRSVVDEEEGVARRVLDAFIQYQKWQELTSAECEAFKTRLVPALRDHHPDVDILSAGGNVWGMERTSPGAADFIARCYVTRVNQPVLLELCLDAESIPALDQPIRAQNVLDGLALAGVFGVLRDQIHDQRPGTHEIIGAMIAYYESDFTDPEPLKVICAKSRSYFSERYRADSVPLLLDPNNYAKERVVRRPDRSTEQARAIDILRRVYRNTAREVDQIPPCPMPEWQPMVDRIEDDFQRTERVLASGLEQLIPLVNQNLAERLERKEPSLTPSYIRFLVWLNQLGTRLLKDWSYEDWHGGYKTSIFKELVRFHEMLHANPYRERAFEEWYQSLSRQAGSVVEVYQLVAVRVLDHIEQASHLLHTQHREHQDELLWSGNISDQLIGLVDARHPRTSIGKQWAEQEARA